MHTKWFVGVPEDQHEEVERRLRSYRSAFDDLKALLEGEFESSTPDYDCPSWSHKQADQNGANRKLREILKLITIKE